MDRRLSLPSSHGLPPFAGGGKPRREVQRTDMALSLTPGKPVIGPYQLLRLLGAEDGHRVLQATAHSHTKVAIKEVALFGGADGSAAKLEQVSREVELHTACHAHDNVLTVHDFVTTHDKLFVVTTLCEQGSLSRLMHERNYKLDAAVATLLLSQLVQAVAHVHSQGIAHGSVHPDHILMHFLKPPTLLLGEFGRARRWTPADGLLDEPVEGDLRYLAPETFVPRKRSGKCEYNPQAVDVWAVGVVAFFLFTGALPFDNEDDTQTMVAIAKGEFTTSLPPNAPSKQRTFLEKALCGNSLKRATAQELVDYLAPRAQSAE